jgi:hypothetical protein
VTSRDTLEQLRFKYGEMLAMRLAHEAGQDNEAEARARMAQLASRFPGALREIDDLELGAIRDRIRQLEAALAGAEPGQPWMDATALFHALARGALWAKRWLAGRKIVDDAEARALAVELEAASDGSASFADALVWAADLQRVASPPRGRVMDLVFARVAHTLGTSDGEARRLVFGTPRRERYVELEGAGAAGGVLLDPLDPPEAAGAAPLSDLLDSDEEDAGVVEPLDDASAPLAAGFDDE